MAVRLSGVRCSTKSNAVLEQARQRLRDRFQKRWPAATAAQSATAGAVSRLAPTSTAHDVPEACHLSAARERLRSRYLSKWPAGDRIEPPKVRQVDTGIAASPNYLEEARHRISMRALARFGWPPSKRSDVQVQAPSQASFRSNVASSQPATGGQSFMPWHLPMQTDVKSPLMHLRTVSTSVTSSKTMPLSGLPNSPSLVRPRTVSLIGAPISEGQTLEGLDLAPDAFRQAGLQRIIERLNFNFVDCGDAGAGALNLPETQGGSLVKNSQLIGRKVGELHERVKASAADGNFVLTIGGDHSIASGTITGVRAHNPDMAVIWVDAHADCNTPESSESKNYHGMPLAHVLGWFQTPVPGFEWCDRHLRSHGPLPESQVALVGIRDLDREERAFVKRSGLHVFTMSDVDCFGIGQVMEMALACVDKAGQRPLHLSFDIDGCDPVVAPGTGTRARGGLSYREAHYICERLAETSRLISMDLVEVNPVLDGEQRNLLHGDDPDITGPPTVSLGVELVASALGKVIV